MVDQVIQHPKAGTSLRILASSLSTLRKTFGDKLGITFGGKRNLYEIFGYVKDPTVEHFLAKYRRQDIAKRIVDAPAKATWRSGIELTGPPALVGAWKTLVRKQRLYVQLSRVDRLSSLGHYSLLLLGFADGRDLSTPVPPAGAGSGPEDLLYTKPICELSVTGYTLNEDPTNPRYGQPEFYQIKRNAPENPLSRDFLDRVVSGQLAGPTNSTTTGMFSDITVHWSRVLHIVEDPLEDDLTCTPIMEHVYNTLDDLLKVAGGSAETYWLAGNRGVQVDVNPDIDFLPEEAEELSQEIEDYQHELRRFVRTRGVTMNTLDSPMPSSQSTFDMLISLLSGTTGLPRRVLMGSEMGVVASEQDRANWAERVSEHRELCAEPCILVPLIERLQFAGVLPQGDFDIEWPESFILNPLEQGQMMAQKARAAGNFSRTRESEKVMQIGSRDEYRSILGLEGSLKDEDLRSPLESLDPDAALSREQNREGLPAQDAQMGRGGPPGRGTSIDGDIGNT